MMSLLLPLTDIKESSSKDEATVSTSKPPVQAGRQRKERRVKGRRERNKEKKGKKEKKEKKEKKVRARRQKD